MPDSSRAKVPEPTGSETPREVGLDARSPYLRDALRILTLGTLMGLAVLSVWGLDSLVGLFLRHGWRIAAVAVGVVTLAWGVLLASAIFYATWSAVTRNDP